MPRWSDCSSRPTRPTWRRTHTVASATSRRLCVVSPQRVAEIRGMSLEELADDHNCQRPAPVRCDVAWQSIDVLIVSWNVSALLADCLRSILAQSDAGPLNTELPVGEHLVARPRGGQRLGG